MGYKTAPAITPTTVIAITIYTYCGLLTHSPGNDESRNAATPTEHHGSIHMWYFAWILGLPLAAAFAVLNAMWFELMEDEAVRHDKLDRPSPRQH